LATLKTIRKRIVSVKNTQKITKAMKMVAAAKLRRAQQAVTAIRPYVDKLSFALNTIAKSVEGSSQLISGRDGGAKKIHYLVYTSNRGLCGGFNSNLLKRVEARVKEESAQYEKVDVTGIGKKGREFFRAKKRELKEVIVEWADKLTPEEAQTLATQWIEGFNNGEYDEYWIVYNAFKSALVQEPTFERVIPAQVTVEAEESSNEVRDMVEFIYEPGKKELLEKLIPQVAAGLLYRAHKESLAAELGARMTAMENATGNAKEMIRLLTLQYNRLRQAAITTELMDIVNGAESIK